MTGTSLPSESLLLVFVHGFRGSDRTFKDFPNRLKAICHTIEIDAIVYPRYKTSGDFQIAVQNLFTWLQMQLQERQAMQPDKTFLVVFLGHSMGGMVSAEVILNLQKYTVNPLGKAKVIGLLAYDTPFYSINHRFVSRTAQTHVEQISRHVNKFWPESTTSSVATTTARSETSANQIGWHSQNKSKSTVSAGWGLLAGVVGVAAVGAVAYLAKDKINDAFDHLEFVSTLMDIEGCHKRMNQLVNVRDIMFKCFYAQIPSDDVPVNDPKTFIALPPMETSHYFVPVPSLAESEIDAHTSFFDPSKNDHYYTLGLDSMALISEMVARYQRQAAASRNPCRYDVYS